MANLNLTPDELRLLAAGKQTLVDVLQNTFDNVWGIYTKAGVRVVTPDNIMDLRYDNSSKISTFPTEEGSFATYNKVRSPFKAKITMSVGGSSIAIQDFINVLDQLADNTELYDIVTPEHTYLNANIEKVNYARAHNKGANCIVAHLELVEVRQVAPAYASVTINAKKPQAKDKKKTGKKQEAEAPPDLANYTREEIRQWKKTGIPLPKRVSPVAP